MEPSAGYLHILIPSGGADPGFCRTSLSATLLGYPSSLAVNWDGQLCEDKFGEASWEWGYFLGALKYLKALPEERATDLVLIVASNDTWFQLKPEVLIGRYRAITEQSEKRLQKSFGGNKAGIKRTDIVFAAQKRCHAGKKEHIACYASPEPPSTSSTPGGVYNSSGADSRPRFLNGAMVMGSVASMLAIHKEGYDRWQDNPKLFESREDLFASFFAEQEFQRERLRLSTLSIFQRLYRWLVGSTTFLNQPPPQAAMYAKNIKTADHGIALDYASSLAHIVDGSGDWIRFSEPNTLYSAAHSLNLTNSPPSTQIAQEVEHSRPPFWSIASFSSIPPFPYQDLPREFSWEIVPLYTNLITSTTPVLIVNSPDVEEEVLTTQWKRMWFRPYARKKLQNIAYEPLFPIASEQLNIPGLDRMKALTSTRGRDAPERKEKQWWSFVDVWPIIRAREGIGWLVDPDEGKGEDGWRKWGDTCQVEVQEEAFADEKGRWEDIKVYAPFKN